MGARNIFRGERGANPKIAPYIEIKASHKEKRVAERPTYSEKSPQLGETVANRPPI